MSRSTARSNTLRLQKVRTNKAQGSAGRKLSRKSVATESRIVFVLRELKKIYPDAGIELEFSSSLELLIATILSAQCTDARVNQITAVLFRSFRNASDYVTGPIDKLERIIHSAGFFRQKAKSIRGAVNCIIQDHDGKVPETIEELVQLPGVGRKTANVILGNAFGIPGLPVDTHVIRLSSRLGLTNKTDPEKIEHDLCSALPKSEWTLFSHLLIWHGRRMCKARKPDCASCPLTSVCSYFADNSI